MRQWGNDEVGRMKEWGNDEAAAGADCVTQLPHSPIGSLRHCPIASLPHCLIASFLQGFKASLRMSPNGCLLNRFEGNQRPAVVDDGLQFVNAGAREVALP